MRNIEGENYSIPYVDKNSPVDVERRKPLYVMKFGGTSMGGAREITSVVDIISGHSQDGKSLVVVPSAMSGITNLLVSVAGGVQKFDKQDLRNSRLI